MKPSDDLMAEYGRAMIDLEIVNGRVQQLKQEIAKVLNTKEKENN